MLAVLMVDDDPAILDVTRRFLERGGDMHVTTAESGEEALDLLSRERFDAIVADYAMGACDGITLLKAVRRGAATGDPVFIILTGKSREKVAIDALNAGADFYLRKGHQTDEMFASLRSSILDGTRRRRAPPAGPPHTSPPAASPPPAEADPILRRLNGSSEGAVIVSRDDGGILFMNQTAAPLLGLSSPEAGVGRKILDLLPEAAGDLALLNRLSMGLISKYHLPAGASKREATTRLTRITFREKNAVLLEMRL